MAKITKANGPSVEPVGLPDESIESGTFHVEPEPAEPAEPVGEFGDTRTVDEVVTTETVDGVKRWVGTDVARAVAALAVERDNPHPRVTLVSALETIIGEGSTSVGNSSSTSPGSAPTSDEPSVTGSPSPVPTTENPSGTDQTESDTVRSTDGSTPEITSDSDK